MNWKSLVRLFGQKARGHAANERLRDAYHQVFRGSPSREDQEIVLADLANYTGFYRISDFSVTGAELRQREGMRSTFAHINAYLGLSSSDIEALQNAARHEAAMDERT